MLTTLMVYSFKTTSYNDNHPEVIYLSQLHATLPTMSPMMTIHVLIHPVCHLHSLRQRFKHFWLMTIYG